MNWVSVTAGHAMTRVASLPKTPPASPSWPMFEVGDALGLVALLRQCRADLTKPLPDNGSLLQALQYQCAKRAPLFSADREQAALLALVNSIWTHSGPL